MTMTGEIQGTKKEFIKVFNEMCYSRSGWQVWSDLISTMACSIANAVDRSEPRFSNRVHIVSNVSEEWTNLQSVLRLL